MLDGNSPSADHLTDLGFNVEWSKEDFFLQAKREGTTVVSNSPFSFLKKVFQHLKQIDQPFILLCPSTCIHTKYFYELFKDEKIQLIIPSTKRHFDKYVDGKRVEQKDNCSFYTLYICWQIGLEHDVNFIR